MELAERIKRIRMAKELAIEDVASDCGMTLPAYQALEINANKATFDTLEKIAISLNVSLPFLVDRHNPDLTEPVTNG